MKKLCKICSYSMPSCVEGDYCPDCLTINLYLVGDYRVDPENEYTIRKNWKTYFQKLGKTLKELFITDIKQMITEKELSSND